VIPCSAVVNGEYGYKEISIGVPVILGRKGIDHIIELDLTPEERRDLDHSATQLAKKACVVKEVIDKNRSKTHSSFSNESRKESY
jgi:malate dehydrogenase